MMYTRQQLKEDLAELKKTINEDLKHAKKAVDDKNYVLAGILYSDIGSLQGICEAIEKENYSLAMDDVYACHFHERQRLPIRLYRNFVKRNCEIEEP